MIHKLIVAAWAAVVMAGLTVSGAQAEVGVVLMHGKWGTAKPNSPIGKLAAKLEDAGILVETPSVAWSRDRYLDRDYEAAMADIDQAVDKLKRRGADTIVVGGHSMGANAALGYGARRDGLAGVLAIAPGHRPEADSFAQGLGGDLARAQAAVEAGQGDDRATFGDINQGERKDIKATAKAYVSWFDPNGPAHMPTNAASLKPGTALMWILGSNDPLAAAGPDYAFDAAPAHPHNTYVELSGANHGNAPIKGAKDIIKWLKGL